MPCKCCHFPTLNNPKLWCGSISALQELTLLLSSTEKDTSYVFFLQEDKDEFLIMWVLTFLHVSTSLALAACSPHQAKQERELRPEPTQVWAPKSLTREGSVGAQMTRLWCPRQPCTAPCVFWASLWAKAAPQTPFVPEKITFGKRMRRGVLSQIFISAQFLLWREFSKEASPVCCRMNSKTRINTFMVI